MLSINNQPLPAPYGISLRRLGPNLLSVQAAWRGLTGPQTQQVLGPTAGPFTFSCHDPLLNRERGFSAALTQYKAQPTQDGLWDLDITMEEQV